MRRHNRNHPCPVCGGYDAQPRGSGKRCGGFTSSDGHYAHCSRIECGEQEDGGTWAHRLGDSCRCGQPHGEISCTSDVVRESHPTVDMIALWQSLDRRSLTGERYLQLRGLDPHELRERGVVRFHPHYGSPAVAIRDLDSGEVCGVQFRRIDDGRPKVITARGSRCVGAALHGRPAELDREGVDVAVVVEGFADTLAAALAFPGCAVFGAAGAGRLANTARYVAPRVREIGGWMLIVPHDDDAGVQAGIAAVHAAGLSGLHLDRDLHLVDIGEHNDLADAWRAGWRWHWPALQGATQ
jgi:phage/plasmid primase-like uncharacterized protein